VVCTTYGFIESFDRIHRKNMFMFYPFFGCMNKNIKECHINLVRWILKTLVILFIFIYNCYLFIYLFILFSILHDKII
jgi:hypothetical protein